MRRVNLKFRTKIFLAYAVFVILAVLAFALFFLGPEERRLARREEETLRAVAEGLAERMRFRPSGPVWSEDLMAPAKAMGIRLTLIGPDGRVLGDTHYSAAAMENHHRGRPEVKEALAGHLSLTRHFSRTLRTTFLYLAVPLRHRGRIAGVLRAAKPQREIEDALYRLRMAFAGGLSLAGLLAIAVGLLILRRLVRPLGDLEAAARRLGSGELDARVREFGRDELGTMARTFNRMAARLQELVSNLAAEKEKLSAVLAAMADGVLVFDLDQRVILANRKAAEFLGLEMSQIEGRTPGELLLPTPAKELIAQAISGTSPLEGEFALDFPARRLLHATLVPVCVAGAGASSSTLLVLRDLTALRRLERVRQDFVANVSHELRTPLAAVKLMVETLLGDDPGEARRREFLASIEAECDRLNALVNDLLTLAKLDAGKMPSSPRPLSLPDLTGEITARLFPPEAPRRPRLSFPPDLPPAKADPEHLRQILINLLDNAVRHTPEGTPFGVEATFDANWITVTVWDEGPGIPTGERERIFERFYRLDKARSRAVGGTGLGLAIVKHLVEDCGGRVWVEDGKGARFRFTVPRA